MISNTKQQWAVGESVKIGFLTLRVTGIELTPGDYKPDAYLLCGLGANESRKYRFVPHHGIERLN